MLGSNTLKVDVTIDNEYVLEGSLEILKLVRKDWMPEKVSHKVFERGITNNLLGFYHKEDKDDTVLIRVNGNGTERFLDRKAEVESFELLQKHNCAPNLYCVFNNGLCYEFAHGETLTTKTVRSPNVYRQICKHMAKLHHIPLPKNATSVPCTFTRMRKFLAFAFPHDGDTESYDTNTMEQMIRKEMDELEQHLASSNAAVAFCHNDLHIDNIVYNSKKEKIHFIDYEYAAPNYAAYDIACHFCCFAGIEPVDYSLYPDESFQRDWLRCYVEELHAIESSGVHIGEGKLAKRVDLLYKHVNQFALASHLFWGVWALVQAKYSQIDFDFNEYSKSRLDEYFQRKKEFLSLRFSLAIPDQHSSVTSIPIPIVMRTD